MRFRVQRGMSTLGAVWRVSLLALLVHLLPFVIPQNPRAEALRFARDVPQASQRAALLRPLLSDPKTTADQLRQAGALMLPLSAADALPFARAASQADDVVQSWMLLARACAADRQPTCANEAIARARRADPSDEAPDLFAAELAQRQGQSADEAKALWAAHEKAPRDVATHLRLCRALGEAGDEIRARQELELLRRVAEPQVLVEEARLELRHQRFESAASLLRRATGLNPKLAEGQYLFGMALLERGEIDEATGALRAASTLSQDFESIAALCVLDALGGREADGRTVRLELEQRFPDRQDEVPKKCAEL